MPATVMNRDDAAIQALQDTLAGVRAELLVTQANLAAVMAELAKTRPEPAVSLGNMLAMSSGFAEAVARGLASQLPSQAREVSVSTERFNEWAEACLRSPVRSLV